MSLYWQKRSATWLRMFKTDLSTFPSKEQTMAVNEYLHSVHADGDSSMSEANCKHRRIASQRIIIAAIRVLDTEQQDRLQDILDHIAYDKEYYMPERE